MLSPFSRVRLLPHGPRSPGSCPWILRQEYWSGLSCLLHDLPHPGIEPALMSPALAGGSSLPLTPSEEPLDLKSGYLNPEPLFLTTVLPALQNTCQCVENSINSPTPHQ